MRMLLFVVAGALMVAGCGGGQGGQAQPESSSATATATTATATSDETTSPTSGPTADLPAPGVPSSPGTGLPLPPPPQNPTGGDQVQLPPHLLDLIRADAAQQTGVAPDQVRVVSATAQTWSDGSLGCPRPGESYIQVLVDGYHVFVQAGDRKLDYRTSQTGIRRCDQY